MPQHFLKTFGITRPNQKKAIKELAEEVEQGSFWLCLEEKTHNGRKDLKEQ